MSTKSIKSSKSTNLTNRLREVFGERVQENCPLAPFVRSQVGGVGEYVVRAKTIEEVIAACRIAVEANRPYAVIGEGTATLVSHVGALGVVVVNQTDQIHFSQSSSLTVVEAGVRTNSLVSAAASRGLGGLEFLTGIPGTIGGAVATGATYHDRSLGSFVRAVVLWVTDGRTHQVVSVGALEAEQLLKRSVTPDFKTPQPVILAVHIQFSRLYPEEVLRRLGAYRTRAQQIASPQAVIGLPFHPPLLPEPELTRAINRLTPRGMRFDYRTQLVVANRERIQPVEYRQFLKAIRDVSQGHGRVLEDRLTYLGYWPDEGENESF